MNITGTICHIGQIQQISYSFKKLEFAIKIQDLNQKTGEVYYNYASFQLLGNKTGEINGLKIGDRVTVEFTIKGQIWSNNGGEKYFTNLNAWKITKLVNNEAPTSAPASQSTQSAPQVNNNDNDLPF